MTGSPAQRPLQQRRLSRRSLLAASARAGIGVVALGLAGCGDGDTDDTTTRPPTTTDGPDTEPPIAEESPSPAARPLSDATLGGSYRTHGSLTLLDSFDIHRSAFITTQRFSALQQNRLIRFADINAGILEGDLADLPEMPDAETYVFTLRPGIRWWDQAPTNGRLFTSEDVHANVRRQIAAVGADGEPDRLFRRQAAYAQTASLEVLDSATVVFRTVGPNAPYLSATHASPWAFYQAPEIWESFGEQLQDEPLQAAYYSGTGPFIIGDFTPGERIVFRRNPTYFRPQRPFLDRIESLHLPDPSEQERAYREGRIDAWSPGDPETLAQAQRDFPTHHLSERPLAVPVQVRFSFRDEDPTSPFRDPRLALAQHLALDRFALIEAIYNGAARASGPHPWFVEGWAMPEETLLQLPGYRRDKREDTETARQLIDASGYRDALPLTVTNIFAATHPGVTAHLAEMLEAALGLSVRVALASQATISQGLRDGSIPTAFGWGEFLSEPDPTTSLLRTTHSAGRDNLGGFANPDIDAAMERMQRTLDGEERRRIFQDEIQLALLTGPNWMVNIAHGIQRTLSRSYVQAPPFGFGWDWHHFEATWLDANDPEIPG